MNVKVEKVRTVDDAPDLSWLGEFTDTPGPEDRTVTRHPNDRFGRYAHFGEYRYFVAAMSGTETGNPESVRQDYEQAEAYNRGEWCEVGIKVRVTLTDDRGFSKVVESPGLWGVWWDYSDEDKEHESVAFDQWEEVRDEVVSYLPVTHALRDVMQGSLCAHDLLSLAEWTD